MSAPLLNLATHPLRNERLPALVVTLALVVLVGVSVEHALVVRRLLPSRTSALHRRVADLEAEAARLRKEAAGLRGPRPDAASVKQWGLLKELVDRRAFSWTELFARLEEVQPPGVRLLSITPNVREGDLRLELKAVARTAEEGFDFLRALQQQRDFPEATLLSVDDAVGGTDLTYETRYLPAARPAPERARAESPS